MSEEDVVEKNVEGGKWQNYLAICLLCAAYAFAIYKVVMVQKTEGAIAGAANTIVLRMTHWQLESGVREALDIKIKEFEKIYKERTGKTVKIIQNPINEKAYKQYVQTQCIGGTAPDLIQIGFYDQAYTRRFFMANNEYITKPNPYNEGTDLEGVAWADTYIDGMHGALDQETLDYYGAGLSHFTIRIFYNKKILKEGAHLDRPPSTFREFFEVCDELKEWAKKNKIRGFVPVAGSQYQLNQFGPRYISYLTFKTILGNDIDNDGKMSTNEPIFAFMKGIYSFDTKDIKAAYKVVQKITSYFPVAFMAQSRMEAGFAFTSGKAAFIASGAWDANSYFQSANFPVGVCDFPMPLTSDPELGQFITGPGSEVVSSAGFRFGITKFSKHPEVAVDFLMFLSSRKNNEEINQQIKWLPLIKGAQVKGVMKNFEPDMEGLWGGNLFFSSNGSRSFTAYSQSLWEFVEQKTTYEEFAKDLKKALPRAYAIDLQRNFAGVKENNLVLDATISLNLGIVQFGDQWSLPEDKLNKLQNRAKLRMSFLWESRVNRMSIYLNDLFTFKKLLDEGNPMAEQVLGFMTENPFDVNEE